jgi:hypothetical protein
MTLQLNFLLYEENFVFFFISVEARKGGAFHMQLRMQTEYIEEIFKDVTCHFWKTSVNEQTENQARGYINTILYFSILAGFC